jgi:hypothetical protein
MAILEIKKDITDISIANRYLTQRVDKKVG